jgi:dTDP-glucose 4,6-dehydratase
MSKRLLLTGVSGSIGTHTLIHLLHNTDWDIVGIATFKHKGLAERITEMLRDHKEYWDRFTLITHDLTQPITKDMQKRIGHIDYIINMASLSDVEASIQDPVPFIRNNVDIAVNMLEYAREAKPEAFVQISTDEVYGPSTKDQQHPEWSPIVPSNPYSASKAAQEAIAISYWRTYGVPLVITNTMNNFGEMQQGSKFPVMLQKWIDRGETVLIHGSEDGGEIGSRYYLHSRNHADAVLYILKNLPPHLHQPNQVDKPDRYNVVGDVQLSNLELAEKIAQLMGKPLKHRIIIDVHTTRPGHDRHYGLDGTKLKKLGWKSPVGFEESMKNTVEWQQERPEWLTI